MFGIVGAAIILIAFILNQLGKWPTSSNSYDLANLIGSAILTYYAYTLGSWPFMVLNSVWFLVSLKDVVASLKK
jgi:hypothetical protein